MTPMCGKFTQLASWQDVHAFSQPLAAAPPDAPAVVATPMRFALVLRLDGEGRRELVPMRWGFADRAASAPARPKHMHVRAETIDARPTFADSFRTRRGVLMVQTFNEGETLPNGRTRQWTITPGDGRPLAIAVIYETWVNGAERLDTFVQVTTPANALIAPVTDRMPAVLQPEDVPVWLGEVPAAAADLKARLRTFEDQGAWRIAEQASPPKRSRRPEPPGLF